jgi:hypothetical protein
MHTTKVLRSNQFRVIDDAGNPCPLVDGITAEDRLGIVSPRYEDALRGASAAILLFVTAFYDLQRAQQEETGQPFFIYPEYYAFLFAEGSNVRGQDNSAPLESGISKAYGELDIWPDEKWVVVQDAADLWRQVAARGITHLLLPAYPATDLDDIPATVLHGLRATYRYLLPEDPGGSPQLRIELADEPRQMIAEALRALPALSAARTEEVATYQRIIVETH